MQNQTKKRVAVYVDGFNIYHAMDEWAKNQCLEDHTLKWLDIRSLAKMLCRPEEKFSSVSYFSAIGKKNYQEIFKKMKKGAKNDKICEHKDFNCRNHSELIKEIDNRFERTKDESKRHDTYIKALNSIGIACYTSKFRTESVYCRCCGKYYLLPKEKQTDVRIALRIIGDAYENKFDVMILVSADGDFFPVLEEIVNKHKKEARIAVSSLLLKKEWAEKKLSRKDQFERTIKKQELDLYKKIAIVPISEGMLRQCQLPDIIILRDGRQIRRPDKYRHPSSS